MTRLFVPAPNGARPAFEQTRPSPGLLRGVLTMPGDAWVAADPRIDTPYSTDAYDVLFVVDSSAGTDALQSELVGGFGAFLEPFRAVGNWHIGVTSMDMDDDETGANGIGGRLREIDGTRWIDATVTDPAEVFDQMAAMGTDFAAAERGTSAAHAALESRAGSDNAGFQRPQADLAVVFVSNESNQIQGDELRLSDWLEWFDGLKSAPLSATAFAIVELPPGVQYAAVARETGEPTRTSGRMTGVPFSEGSPTRS